ncbi:hypothetical protein FQR65_LT00148 [Abscondita terminalis]|nr:hypothetical protein FQR65_LT00148 [Abscondita terminalis]
MGLNLSTTSSANKNPIVSTPEIRRLNEDPRSPSSDILRTPIEVMRTPVRKVTTTFSVEEEQEVDPRSPNTEYSRTPIQVPIHNKHLDTARQTAGCTPKLLQSSTKIVKQENKRNSFVGLLETNIDFVETDLDNVASTVEDQEIKSLNEELFEDIEELELSVDKCVEELDKKLTDLIYENAEINIKTNVIKARGDNRTPLGDRHVNQNVPVLKVHDKPTRLPKNISKIPVFKEKKIKGHFIQCENTPPRAVNNRSHWSTEDSLII